MIESNPDLPGDVVMFVRKDGVILHEVQSNGEALEIARGSFPDGTVNDLKGKLELLEWVHDHFTQRAEAIPVSRVRSR